VPDIYILIHPDNHRWMAGTGRAQDETNRYDTR
jgi:hypothetical protein